MFLSVKNISLKDINTNLSTLDIIFVGKETKKRKIQSKIFALAENVKQSIAVVLTIVTDAFFILHYRYHCSLCHRKADFLMDRKKKIFFDNRDTFSCYNIIGQNASEKVMIALFVRKEVNKKTITYNIRLTLTRFFLLFIKHSKFRVI